jgi:hypothetical protein
MSSPERLDVIFLGPSLSREEARLIHPDAIILPPARAGDVVSVLLNYRPHAIGLVDGLFRNTMAVFHKELLEAMAQGVWVLGSSSMGALRAAECERFGMIGVGSVFEQYRSGLLEDDDEVAVAHGDHESGYRTTGAPMVTIRATLLLGSATDVLTPDEARELIAAEKAKHFSDRGFHGVLDTAKNEFQWRMQRLDALRDFIRECTLDVKADDARQLLLAMQTLPTEPIPVAQRPSGHLSGPFITLLDRDRLVGMREDAPVSFDSIMRYVALNRPEHDANRRRASHRQALLQIGRILDLQPTSGDLMEAHMALTARVGSPLSEWGVAVDLTPSDLDRLTSEEAVIATLEKWAIQTRTRNGFARAYLDELRLAGLYPEMRNLAGEVEKSVALAPLVEGLTLRETLTEHISRTGWTPPASWPSFVEESDLGENSGVLERLTTFVTAGRTQGPGKAESVDALGEVDPLQVGLTDPQERPMRSRGA